MNRWLIACATLLMCAATEAPAQIYQPSNDSYVGQNDCITIYGGEDRMRIRNRFGFGHSDGWETDATIRFDLSSIPHGTQVESARLNLYYYYWWDNDPAGRVMDLHRLLGDWSEETLQWCNLPDRAAEVSAQAIVPYSFGWMSWDVTADVQAFVNGTADNYGWFLTDPVPWDQFNIPITYFHSKEHPDLQPSLEVTTGGTPVEQRTWGSVKTAFR